MDQVSIILTALASGAAAGLKDSVNLALKDSYHGLKTLIQQKFAGKLESETALSLYTDDPLMYEKPLREALAEIQIEHDQAVIEAAQRLLTLTQPQQSSTWKYNTQITGNVHGYAQGDYQRVDMHFGDCKG
jgi:CMP-N-acetylneuraminic acid synthetase